MTRDGLNSTTWWRVSELLDQLLEMSPAERSAALEATRRADREVAGLAESLLAADEHAGAFLEAPTHEALIELVGQSDHVDAPTADDPVAVVGPYRIVREIGRGGMGVVYLAERADGQFEQRLALKLLKRGLDTDDVMRRFLRERQILARLEHPAICRLLDGGVSSDGRPFFAMEYIEGEPITSYCDRRRLIVEDRLHLMLAVCEGVQYAHRNLIVHRDLKPANILVDGSGQPKLLDFGIAKVLSPDPSSAPGESTRAGDRVMTPEYATPEQVRGEPVTTETDVYALGLLLYELVCGHQPQRMFGRSRLEAQRLILDGDPLRPSVAARTELPYSMDGQPRSAEDIAGARRLNPRRLERRLAGDVDTIVLKALRKDPARRYPSVEAFARDIERHLHELPIQARQETVAYRIGKFASRHRTVVAASAALISIMVAGLATTAWQAREKSREAQRAEAVTEFLVSVFEVSDPDQSRGERVSARELLDQGARRLETELVDQPEVRAELLGVVGELYRTLGLLDQAGPLLQRAVEADRSLYGPDNVHTATAERRWGTYLFDRGQYDAAEDVLGKVVTVQERLLGQRHPEVGSSLSGLAAVLTEKGEYRRAEAMHRRALDISIAAYGEASVEAAEDMENLAVVLWQEGEFSAAEPLHRRALELHRQLLGLDHPATATSMHGLATLLSAKGDYEEAEELFRQAIEIRTKLFGRQHPAVAESLSNYSVLLERRGRLDEARSVALEALDIDRQLLGPDHPDLAVRLNNYGVLCYRHGDYSEAEESFRSAMEIWQAQLGHDHPNVASSLNNIGVIRLEIGDPAGAEPLIREGLAIRRAALGPDHQLISQSLRNLGLVLLDLGRTGEAEHALEESLDMARRVYPAGHPRIAEVLVGLGEVRLAQHRATEAASLLREAQQIRTAQFGGGDWRTAEVEALLGQCFVADGRTADGVSLLSRSLQTLSSQLGDQHRLTRRAREQLRIAGS